MSLLIKRFFFIEFTVEINIIDLLLFLDVPFVKNSSSKLKFDVFRHIPNSSQNLKQHKMASLGFLVYLLLSFPINAEGFEKENNCH